jgi:hypothetical protein
MHINHRGLTHLAPANIASIATCSASLASSILRCLCRSLRCRFSFLPPLVYGEVERSTCHTTQCGVSRSC